MSWIVFVYLQTENFFTDNYKQILFDIISSGNENYENFNLQTQNSCIVIHLRRVMLVQFTLNSFEIKKTLDLVYYRD